MNLFLVLILLFALALIGAPLGLPSVGVPVSGMSSMIMVSSGIAFMVFAVILLTITHLYVKTKASEAFVRTGMGGMKVIRDGGAIVLPVIHQIVRVSLETIRLEVKRNGGEALITSDKLRADIKGEFFVRVQAEDDAIMAAARSLGDKMMDGGRGVASLIEDKLVSALRTSAARKTLEQLNSERDEFLKEVTGLVSGDLQHNGFTLETVTISALDQTDEANLKANNIFDAQGMRTIAEVTQKNLTQKNAIVREHEMARQQQDVDARRKILELDKTRAEAEAKQQSDVQVVQLEQARVAAEKKLAADRSVQVATIEQQRAREEADRTRQAAIVLADQGVEVAKREQQKAIAAAEAEKALEEKKLAEAEAERMAARQQIQTVEQVATAEREKRKQVIAAEGVADQELVKTQRAADGQAYRIKAEADAKKASADAEAEAIRKGAEAASQAQQLRALGQLAELEAEAKGKRAIEMVPVDVASRMVEVDKSRVEDVLKPELTARAENGDAAQKFELAKLQIEADARVKIESAHAMATLYGKVSATVFGTPEDVARMGESFATGMGLAQTAKGLFAQVPPEIIGQFMDVILRRAAHPPVAAEAKSAGVETPPVAPEQGSTPSAR